MDKTNDEIVSAVLEKTFKDGEKVKLACAAAFTIADQFGVNPSEIGSICNDRNIRICHCQLGCFK